MNDKPEPYHPCAGAWFHKYGAGSVKIGVTSRGDRAWIVNGALEFATCRAAHECLMTQLVREAIK